MTARKIKQAKNRKVRLIIKMWKDGGEYRLTCPHKRNILFKYRFMAEENFSKPWLWCSACRVIYNLK